MSGDAIVNERATALVRLQLLDEMGRPLAAASITALAVTLWDLHTLAVINSRSDTSIYGANGGSVSSDLTITGASKANPCRVTCVGHSLLSGDKVHISGVGGMTELNGRVFVVDVVSDDTFNLRDENSLQHTAYTSGGTARTGLATWVMDPADNQIVDPQPAPGQLQEHRATFRWTYATSRTGRHERAIMVRQLQKVTS